MPYKKNQKELQGRVKGKAYKKVTERKSRKEKFNECSNPLFVECSMYYLQGCNGCPMYK